jgi:tRNA modification GTPase
MDIAAIATPDAPGGISVIRISGENAIGIAASVFTCAGEKSPLDMPGYTCAYGFVHDGDEHIDDAVLTVFRAPKSYTGENCAEISCH